MTIRVLFAAALLAGPMVIRAQTDGVLQHDDEVHRFLQVQQTKGNLPGAFLSHRSLSVYEARKYLEQLAQRDSAETVLRPPERQRLHRLQGVIPRPNASWIHNRLSLYENGHDMMEVTGDRYALQLNPQYYGFLGPALHHGQSGRFANGTAWRNSRGLRLSGHVGDHLFFESRLSENQWQPIWPAFENNTAPRTSHISFYEEGGAYNFFSATGILGIRTPHFEVRGGRDRNHWGPGQGSLFLSDYATAYDQFQIRTTLKPLQYTYLFARFLDAETELGGNGLRRPSRYGAFHHLSLHVTEAFRLSLFESVILGPNGTGAASGFDLAYLNPVILFRPVERDLGSGGNALLGTGATWRFLSGAELYGQFVLDELRVSEIGSEWWGNKWGWMLGVHLAEVGVPHVSARIEATRLRPYLYTHRSSSSAYLHMGDVLGHPAGPNSGDLSFFLNYEPPGPWRTLLGGSWTLRGRNEADENGEVLTNYGGDPTIPSTSRNARYGVSFLQGIRQRHGLLEMAVEYEILPQFRVTAAVRGEHLRDAERGTDYYISPRLLLNWGFPFQQARY